MTTQEVVVPLRDDLPHFKRAIRKKRVFPPVVFFFAILVLQSLNLLSNDGYWMKSFPRTSASRG